jgi:p24 family protein alpha
LCFTPQNVQGGGGWLGNSGVHGSVRFHLDMAIGETSKIESTDKGKIDDLAQKLRDLNSRLQDIRREQVFQRVCLPNMRGLRTVLIASTGT